MSVVLGRVQVLRLTDHKMRDYLGRREMPKHLHIAPESVIDMEAYQAVVTPYYRNGNILEFINKRAVDDGRKLQLVSDIR